MKQRTRIYYTESQKALMWDRWQKGDSLNEIARLFDRNHSSIQGILAAKGGYSPAPTVPFPTGTEPVRARGDFPGLGSGALDASDG